MLKMKIIYYLCVLLVLTSCTNKDLSDGDPYPLLALFTPEKNLDDVTVKVIGYFGYWDGDIPVLFATYGDIQKSDGLYKSHIIYQYDSNVKKAATADVGKICIFKATVWYRGKIPTLDNASLVECKTGVRRDFLQSK